MKINRKMLPAFTLAAGLVLSACAQAGKPQSDRDLRGMGYVVDSRLAAGAAPKEYVMGMTDAGNQIFAFAYLTSKGGQVNSAGGGTNMSFPQWVRVTWREGPSVREEHGVYVGGTILGDYKVEVLSRIPGEVFRYAAAAPGRAVVLMFRLKDDGVLFAWDVQEIVVHPRGGRNLVYSMHGGDFPCETSSYQPSPICTEGPLEAAPWYNPQWIRK